MPIFNFLERLIDWY